MTTVPPAHPKRRRRAWQPPSIGDSYVLDADGTVWHVRQIHRHDKQVHLVASIGDRHRFVYADELERDWTQVP